MDGRGRLDFLVVQELFLTETAALADVVLPAQSWAEREGTFTNGERRVQRYYPAIPAMGEARPDWQILAQINERVGLGKPPFAASLVFKEIAASVGQYKGMDFRTLAHVEPQWPIVGGSDLYFGGTAYANRQGLGQQWPAAAEAGEMPNYELPIDAPIGLSGGGFRVMRIPALYTPGTLIDYTDLLNRRIARPTLYLNPTDVMLYAEGEPVTVTVAGESYEVAIALSESAPAGVGLLCGVPGARPMGLEPAIVGRSVEPVAAD
jgi:NADH-quinone oxidoreductase subunit G